MDFFVKNLLPQTLRDPNKYPYMSATSEVSQVVLALYYSEIAKSVRELYNLDGDYYLNNINNSNIVGDYVRENIDKLIDTYIPFVQGFVNDYNDKRGLLSFSDAFFASKGTTNGLFGLFNFLGLPMVVYTDIASSGDVKDAGEQREHQLERVGPAECEPPGEEEPVLEPKFEYEVAEWEVMVANKLTQLRGDNINFAGNASSSGESARFAIDISGYIYVERGVTYSFLIGSDDGSKLSIGENEEYGSCWVPSNGRGPNSRDPYSDYTNPDSWKTPPQGGFSGKGFRWGNRWIEFIADKTGYIPIRVQKETEAGGPYQLKIIGGEKSIIESVIQGVPGCNAADGRVACYDNLPKWPDSLDARYSNWEDKLAAKMCNYQQTVYSRHLVPTDPGGLLDDYDIVVSINLNDKISRGDVAKANADSWKYYGKSLQARIHELVKEFTWICADVIAYLYYATQDIVRVRDKLSVEIEYRFKEKTLDFLTRSQACVFAESAESATTQIVRPPAEVDYVEPSGLSPVLDKTTTDTWGTVSSINGTSTYEVPFNAPYQFQLPRFRACSKPRLNGGYSYNTALYDNSTKKATTFFRGGIFVGTTPRWYSENDNLDLKNWVTKNLFKSGIPKSANTDVLNKAQLVSANATVFGKDTNNNFTEYSVDNENDTFEVTGSTGRYPSNIMVLDRMTMGWGKFPKISIAKREFSFTHEAQVFSDVNLQKNQDVGSITITPSADWITVNYSETNKIFSVSVSKNDTGTVRVATIKFVGANGGRDFARVTQYSEPTN